MIRAILFVFLFSTAQAAIAQNFTKDSAAASITIDGLNKHVLTLCSEAMAGRKAGSAGANIAASYIANEFAANNLKPPGGQIDFYQPFNVPAEQVVQKLSINGIDALYGKDFLNLLRENPWKYYKANGLVFGGYGIEHNNYSDYSNIDVTDKVVVVMMGEPTANNAYLVSAYNAKSYWSTNEIKAKVTLAAAKGAKGIFFINNTNSGFSANDIIAGMNPRKQGVSGTITINHTFISEAFARDLFASSSMVLDAIDKGRKEQPLNVHANSLPAKISFELNLVSDFLPTKNVVGILEGTSKKDEYVYVIGHYDHDGVQQNNYMPGADDNASGTAALLEIANAFASAKKRGLQPKRTIVFVAFSAQDLGLLGSYYYVTQNHAALKKTSAVFDIDMIGRADIRRGSDTLNYIYVVGGNQTSSEMMPLLKSANEETKLSLDDNFDTKGDKENLFSSSDHYPFAAANVPAILFYDGMEIDHHRVTDTPEKLHWNLYQKRVEFIFNAVWEAANRDKMLKRDR